MRALSFIAEFKRRGMRKLAVAYAFAGLLIIVVGAMALTVVEAAAVGIKLAKPTLHPGWIRPAGHRIASPPLKAAR